MRAADADLAFAALADLADCTGCCLVEEALVDGCLDDCSLVCMREVGGATCSAACAVWDWGHAADLLLVVRRAAMGCCRSYKPL